VFDAAEGDLRRRVLIVNDAIGALVTAVQMLPGESALADWRGPARATLHLVVERERELLRREIHRLEGVCLDLLKRAALIDNPLP
jgi:hypothetical protein